MKKKRLWQASFALLGIALVVGLIWFATLTWRWNSRKDDILEKLAIYKRQIDLLRSPLPIETRSGAVSLGAVALPSRIFDRNGTLIGEFYHERRQLVPIQNIPKVVIDALISSEDRKFYQHSGVNFSAILRAFWVNLLEFRFAQGGSTLTQQLAKVLFTTSEKTLDRKVFEMFCAWEIEKRYVKNEILEMYLNLVYMGNGNYGIEAASHFLFNKETKDLTLAESAMIIGLLPNPNVYSPLNNPAYALKRQKLVIKGMVDTSKIKDQKAKQALKHFKKQWKVSGKGNGIKTNIGVFPDRAWRKNLAPFFLEFIRQDLIRKFSREEITRGGLQVYTTLDYKKQQNAKASLKAGIEGQRNYYKSLLKTARAKKRKKDITDYKKALQDLNGAFIAIEPKTGYITVMIGGSHFSTGNQYNRAVLAHRQIGSLMKPFVYYLALSQKRITPADFIRDTPLKAGKYNFKNYDNKYLGDITVYNALKMSRNTPAIRALQMTSIDDLRRMLSESLDISYNEIAKRVPREIGVALGTPTFSPFEVARVYANLVNNGIRVDTRYLLRIEDPQGKILWEAEPPAEVSILDPLASQIIVNMMQGVFEEGGTSGWVSKLRTKDSRYIPFDIAGKTGTTSDYLDAWFTGITKDEVSVIWIGSDSNISLGSGRSGGSLCAPIYINYIRSARKNDTVPPLFAMEPEDGLVRESFCASSGGIPRAQNSCPDIVKDQLFFEGSEPKTFDTRGPADGDPF